MKEYPLLAKASVVQNILAGRQTQDRRPMKPQPTHEYMGHCTHPPEYFDTGDNNWACIHCGEGIGPDGRSLYHARYQPGDRLWVRETWADLRGTGIESEDDVAYRANSLNADGRENSDAKRCREDYGIKWRPSIHMPRWASRITLEVTAVRCEQIRKISDKDCIDEGIEETTFYSNAKHLTPIKSIFADLWQSLYPGSWEKNSWVWVYEFRRVSGE